MAHIIGYLISYAMEGFALWQYSSLFLPKKREGYRIRLLIGLYFVLFLVAPFDLKWLNAILYIGANTAFLFSGYRQKWFVSFFHSVLITAIMGMCELFVYAIMDRMVPHFFMEKDAFLETTLYVIFSKSMFLLFVSIITSVGKLIKIREERSLISLFYIFIPVVSVFSMLLLVTILDNYPVTVGLKRLVVLDSVLILGINILIYALNLYSQKRNEEYTNLRLAVMKEKEREEYYKMLRAQGESQRILLHDIKNHLRAIEMLNKEGEREKLDRYLKELYDSPGLRPNIQASDNEMLNLILSDYRKNCESVGVGFYTDIRSGSTDFMEDSDLTTLFGNLLDNAKEAAEKCENAFVEVFAGVEDGTDFLLIKVRNSCSGNPFKENEQNLQTTKKDKSRHGIGLKSIRQIIKKYDGNMEMNYDSEGRTFQTVILFPCK